MKAEVNQKRRYSRRRAIQEFWHRSADSHVHALFTSRWGQSDKAFRVPIGFPSQIVLAGGGVSKRSRVGGQKFEGRLLRKMIPRLALLIAGLLAFTGCLNLKPVVDTTRSFVLTPLADPTTTTLDRRDGPAIGIRRVDIPDYLQPKGIVQRRSLSELQYSETLLWAERFDKGIQRVLGLNIGALMGSTNVVFSDWRRHDVQVEIHVSMQRFESDAQGQVSLEAHWRVMSPGAERIWHTGVSRITKQGPPSATDPDGAVVALSEALADLSREIVVGVRDSILRHTN